ncbi:MAG TPA: amino acid adenylation domain-containing protein, partial [Longimicrobium sp.]|nr:amino acid adenylation domain-containing protein [Longimicrobium sp.]
AAFRAGEPSPLPEPRLQYADFAAWQRGREGEVEAGLAYWRERLAGSTPLELPADGPRGESAASATVRMRLPEALADAVARQARAAHGTAYMVLLAAWQALLARWTGQDEVIVASPVARRARPELEEVVGFFVDTLPLRTDVAGDPTARELLGRVREVVLGAYAQEELPLERVAAVSGEERGADLFRVAFSLHDEPSETLALPGITSEAVPLEGGEAKFDLLLTAIRGGGGVELLLEYRKDLLAARTAEALLARYARLLEQMVADPSRRLSRLELLSPEEHVQVVADWNRTSTAYPRERCVHELFAEHVALTPHATALDGASGALTYAQLDTRANRLAHLLRARGVREETRVGVLLERGPELIVALLAILKAGGAYVPLDPEYPPERLGYMLRDSGAALVVSTAALAGRPEEVPCPVLHLDEEALEDWPETPPESGAGAESLAYIIYTSGSTGTPKGVMVPHRGIVRLVRGSDYAPLAGDDRVAQLSSASFDAATWELWAPLTSGAALVFVPRETLLDPRGLAELVRERGVTTIFLTTALFHHVARHAPGAFGGVRRLLFGGEQADPAAVRAVLESSAPERILHVYGPTENTTYSTWHRVERVEDGANTVPIGRAIAQSTAYVLDPALRPVPVGVWGELYVGGDGVARGYRGRTALTAERFVPDEFSRYPGARMYRTGDRVRWTAEGVLEFGGRFDQQVKIRGYRIEPGEIEAALLANPEVAEAVVVLLGQASEKRLVAYVVARGEADLAALRADLRERLPAYMLPAAMVALDRLPITANGKLDRRALPHPEHATERAFAAPRTPEETALAAIWDEVLGVERVGVEDGFFELG